MHAGVALLRAGQPVAAERFFREYLDRQSDGEAWFYLGAAQHVLGKLESALTSFGKAVELSPDASEARCARATVLASLNRTHEAEDDLRAVIGSVPAHAQALFNLGVLRDQGGDKSEALALYTRALEVEPAHPDARLNRGALNLELGDPEAALDDFEKLDSIAGRNNRTKALLALHRDADALRSAEAVLAGHPGDAQARGDKAVALASLGRLDEAAAASPRVNFDALTVSFARAQQRGAKGDWQGREQAAKVIGQLLGGGRSPALADPGMLLHALAYPLGDRDIRLLANAVAEGVKGRAPRLPAMSPVTRDGRVRVGFLTPEVREHHAAYILRRIFKERDRGRFEYFLYALNPDDGSAIHGELRSLVDAFVDCSSLDTELVASRLRQDGLDILLDRVGYFAGSRPEVLAHRVAAVHAGFMGTPCTLGEGLLDYRLSDALTTPPESQDQWNERLVLLPPPHAVFDADLAKPRLRKRHEFGLPEDAPVLCYFDLTYKISREVFDVWMTVLREVPKAVLWLMDDGKATARNFRRNALEQGVQPERLHFAPVNPYGAHFECLPLADLFVDTFFYSARSMAFDALNAGVPVLTCAGATMASRLSVAFLDQLQLHELIATSPQDYANRAIKLLQGSSLEHIKATLRGRRGTSGVFDTVARIRALERAFVAMVERHRAGLPADTLIVD